MREDLLDAVLKSVPQTDDYAGRTVAVTGASGQIGLNVIALALARGARVVAIYRSTSIAFAHPRLTWLNADLASPDGLSVPPADILIHTAAIWLLPDTLPHFAAAGIARIVAFSSTSLFGKRESANAAEQAMVERLTTAEQRLSADAEKSGLRLTILRPTMIYGMGLDANITRMARMIKKFGFVAVSNPAQGLRQPVQARDLAEAALAVWDKPQTWGKAYNLGGGDTLTYRAMVERLFRHLGREPRLVALPLLPQTLDLLNACLPFIHVNGEVARRMNRDLAFDNGPATADFGYRPRGFLAGDIVL